MRPAAMLVALSACAKSIESPAPPPVYRVVIDASFTDTERETVVSGIDAWTAAVGPDLTFGYSVDTADRLAVAPAIGSSELHVLRLSTLGDLGEPCLLQGGWLACYADGRAYLAMDDIEAASMGAPQALTDQTTRTLSCHEVGHFLGLVHTDVEVSVMRPELADMYIKPSVYDVVTYCGLHPCPSRQRDQ